MATKTVYPIGDFRYGTRMMRAGDSPIEMNSPDRRLYLALGKVSLTKPRGAKVEAADTVAEPASHLAPATAAPAAKPRKRTRKAKK